jgi:hypothetical protein
MVPSLSGKVYRLMRSTSTDVDGLSQRLRQAFRLFAPVPFFGFPLSSLSLRFAAQGGAGGPGDALPVRVEILRHPVWRT